MEWGIGNRSALYGSTQPCMAALPLKDVAHAYAAEPILWCMLLLMQGAAIVFFSYIGGCAGRSRMWPPAHLGNQHNSDLHRDQPLFCIVQGRGALAACMGNSHSGCFMHRMQASHLHVIGSVPMRHNVSDACTAVWLQALTPWQHPPRR
jgi:hypothetical protein